MLFVVEGVLYGAIKPVASETIRELARKLNASEIVMSWVSGGSQGMLFSTRGFVYLFCVIFDGSSGEPVFTKEFRGGKDSTFGTNTGARVELLQEFVRKMMEIRYGRVPSKQ